MKRLTETELSNKDCSVPKGADCQGWTKKKIAQLLEFAELYEQNWRFISRCIQDFGEDDCRMKFSELSSKKKECDWEEWEDAQLAALVEAKRDVNWFEISVMITGRNACQCRRRWTQLVPGPTGSRPWGVRE